MLNPLSVIKWSSSRRGQWDHSLGQSCRHWYSQTTVSRWRWKLHRVQFWPIIWLCCGVYSLFMWPFVHREIVGFSLKNSVASMITLASGYFLNDFGNCCFTASRFGQQNRVPLKIFANKHTQVVTILQMEVSETPNMSPKCRFRSPKCSLQSTKRYSSFSESCLFVFQV